MLVKETKNIAPALLSMFKISCDTRTRVKLQRKTDIYIWVILLKTGQNCDIEVKIQRVNFLMLLLEMKA